MWKSVTEPLANAKELALAPLSNVLCLFGVALVVGSFFGYDHAQGLSVHATPGWLMMVTGAILVSLGIAVFVLSQRDAPLRTRLNYKKGVVIKRGELTITIKEGEIQNTAAVTQNTGIVLPANTTFHDDCVIDERGALGAFCIAHFPGSLSSLTSTFKLALDSSGLKPNSDGRYAAGATIVLPEEFEKPAKILITASTTRTDEGISTNPHIICNCVEEIFRKTKTEVLDTINMPILGSGHGGVDRGLALLFLLLAILHYSKTFHHLKAVNIVVHPKDVDSLNHSKELRQIVAL